MPLPPVIERLKQKARPSELGDWVRENLFNWEVAKNESKPDWIRRYLSEWRLTQTERRFAAFGELFAKFGTNLQESAVCLAEIPEDDPYWQSAPKSQSFDPVLSDFLQMELQQTPNDERVLWSLAALEVHHCCNDFGLDYLVPLCIKDPRNIR